MSSGKSHMVMVTSHGRVFGSEDGLSISLIGNADFRQSRILEVACGEVHTLARDDQGRGWAWGINGFGQLAQGAYSHANLKLPNPTLIKDIAGTEGGVECVKVAAGGQSSYFVLKEGNVFKVKSAGMGQWGQLGDGSVSSYRCVCFFLPLVIYMAEETNAHVYFVVDIVHTYPGLLGDHYTAFKPRRM